jgi:hypothetical protein
MYFYCYCVWYADGLDDRCDRGFFAARGWRDAMDAIESWYGADDIWDVRLLVMVDDRCEVDDWPYATGSDLARQVEEANERDMHLSFMGEKSEVRHANGD